MPKKALPVISASPSRVLAASADTRKCSGRMQSLTLSPLFGGPAPAAGPFTRPAPSEPFPGAPEAGRSRTPSEPLTDPGPAPLGPSGLPTRARARALEEAAAPPLPPRPRTADGVRSTLAGFTDGARRGRHVPAGEQP